MKPKSDIDILQLQTRLIPINSQKKINWAVRLFEQWRQNRNETIKKERSTDKSVIPRCLLDLRDDELSFALSAFLAEVKKGDGKDYPPNTLFEIIMAIQTHVNVKGRRPVKFMSDANYMTLKLALNNVMEQKAKLGLGLQHRQAKIITYEEETILWQKGALGSDTARKLVNTVLYLFGVHFGLRSGDHHRSIRPQNITFGESEEGNYIKFDEGVSKTNSGGLAHRKLEKKSVKAYACVTRPERCIVTLTRKYLSVCPPHQDAFYLTPLKDPKETLWYSKTPMGRNTLDRVTGDMCKQAGFEGRFQN